MTKHKRKALDLNILESRSQTSFFFYAILVILFFFCLRFFFYNIYVSHRKIVILMQTNSLPSILKTARYNTNPYSDCLCIFSDIEVESVTHILLNYPLHRTWCLEFIAPFHSKSSNQLKSIDFYCEIKRWLFLERLKNV